MSKHIRALHSHNLDMRDGLIGLQELHNLSVRAADEFDVSVGLERLQEIMAHRNGDYKQAFIQLVDSVTAKSSVQVNPGNLDESLLRYTELASAAERLHRSTLLQGFAQGLIFADSPRGTLTGSNSC
jgi:hypothetical protein